MENTELPRSNTKANAEGTQAPSSLVKAMGG